MMRDVIRNIFDSEGRKVLFVGTAGAVASQVQIWLGLIVAALSACYIGVKLYKQLRDWKAPDKD